MKDNADPRRIHSAVCVTVQMQATNCRFSKATVYGGFAHTRTPPREANIPARRYSFHFLTVSCVMATG